MAVRTYDPQQVVITVDGTAIGGYADGTFISIEREEESFSKVVGADGAAARSKATNRSARITLTLMQTSPSNEFLSMLLARDERNNSGVFAVIVKDKDGNTIATGTTDANGNFTITVADLPNGLLNPYAGEFTLEIFDNTAYQCGPASWNDSAYCDAYSCISFDVRNGDHVKNTLGCPCPE